MPGGSGDSPRGGRRQASGGYVTAAVTPSSGPGRVASGGTPLSQAPSSTAGYVTSAAKPIIGGFSVGDKVSIWSESAKKWITDGTVSQATPEEGIVVVYDGGSKSKAVPADKAAEVLKKNNEKE